MSEFTESKEGIEINCYINSFFVRYLKTEKDDEEREEYRFAPRLRYTESWDWQIKVLSRLTKLIAKEEKDDFYFEEYEVYENYLNEYQSAMYDNDVKSGVKTLLDIVKWYEANKE